MGFFFLVYIKDNDIELLCIFIWCCSQAWWAAEDEGDRCLFEKSNIWSLESSIMSQQEAEVSHTVLWCNRYGLTEDMESLLRQVAYVWYVKKGVASGGIYREVWYASK